MWGAVARKFWPKSDITGSEVRDLGKPDSYDTWNVGDFTEQSYRGIDLVMGNPPYYCAEACVRRGLAALENGGRMVYLLRLSFLEGKRRSAGLFREHPPRSVTVCPGRPSFYDGKSGMTAFAFYIWEKDWRGDTRLAWGDT